LKYYILVALFIISCNEKSTENAQEDSANTISALNFTLLGSYPHDMESFTEGLFVDNGKIFESTGSPEELAFSKSHYGVLDTLSGKISVKAALDKNKYFGEGIVKFNDKIFQLTYKAQTCFVYDANTHQLLNTFKYNNAEGWGLTHNGSQLIMSDGSSLLTFFNPDDFSVVKSLQVKEGAYGQDKLNELEYVDGYIYANIWLTNQIVKIDANTGEIVAKADFGSLYLDAQKINPQLMEMNGIAYDAAKGEFLLTGKLWPKVYRVKFF
jgi:glutaminyl-peptide cyclotransferase